MPKPKPLPSADVLRAAFRYESRTGRLYWRKREDAPRAWNAKFAGRLAGCQHWHGVVVGLKGYGVMRAHRVIWKMVYGDEPEEIDHIDCNPFNNRLSNLRRATRVQNMWNVRGNGRSGYKGVSLHRKTGRWRARIKVGGKNLCLGYFDDPEAAHNAYVHAAIKHFGEFARVGWRARDAWPAGWPRNAVLTQAGRRFAHPTTRRTVEPRRLRGVPNPPALLDRAAITHPDASRDDPVATRLLPAPRPGSPPRR